MSASIHYRRLSKEDPSLYVMAPSSFIESIERAFGNFPCELAEKDLLKLRGMAAMFPDNEHNPYDELADAIEEHGPVQIYATY